MLRCFGVGFSRPEVDAVISAVCGLLFVLGIIGGKNGGAEDAADGEKDGQAAVIPEDSPEDGRKTTE